ncbi:MAG: GGDEF domain-containing protein [Calditrichaeota bacterium]|nr:GGDEF domain-containing protein [Calditrichota bacterium]
MKQSGLLPEQVVLYRSKNRYQEELKRLLEKWQIGFFEAAFLAEFEDLSFIEKSPCALAIIDDDLRGIEFLRSVMHYHTWTQRIMLSETVNIDVYEQAINRAHVNYLLRLPIKEHYLKTYLIKANRRFQNIIRPLNKLDALTTVTTDLLEANERYRLEAITDPLTQLLNRRSMNAMLENLWLQYLRASINFSFAILDIDLFKKVNDTYGHEVGDQVLRELSSLILRNLRKGQDYAFRYGGEEFALISVNIPQLKMYHFIKRLLELTRDMVVTVKDHKIKITFSAGISDAKSVHSPQELINKADQALYQAKNLGRNRIVVLQK